MAQDHVKSDKISGNHTTFVEPAVAVIKELVKLTAVRRVTPGVIESGLKTTASGGVTIKFTMGDGCLKLQVRTNISVQDIYVYTSDVQATTELAARTARDEDYTIHFDKREVNDLTVHTRSTRHDRR